MQFEWQLAERFQSPYTDWFCSINISNEKLRGAYDK